MKKQINISVIRMRNYEVWTHVSSKLSYSIISTNLLSIDVNHLSLTCQLHCSFASCIVEIA